MAETEGITELIERYVRELMLMGCIRSPAVERAFRSVERHKLLERFYFQPSREVEPEGDQLQIYEVDPQHPDLEVLKLVYTDNALVTHRDEEGRPTSSTSQPALVAMMLEELELKPGMRVLEIGAGTGYNAALMAEIVQNPKLITTIDIQEDVVLQTRRLLERAGYGEIRVIWRDGALGAPEGAPYERIVATVGCPDISWRWVEQLSAEGLMLIPLQHGALHCDPLVKLRKVSNDRVKGKVVGWSGFMLIQGELGVEPLWSPIDWYWNYKDQEPERSYPLFPDFKGQMDRSSYEAGERAWWDFHYFLGLCDRRTYMGASSFGLFDPQSQGVVALTLEGIKLWGDESLYHELTRIYERWVELGRPRLTDWQVELFPIKKAPEASPDREIWEIERTNSRQLVWLA
jgi:protein-L-isoaspartate(D-aspartate) O-methyltransferase